MITNQVIVAFIVGILIGTLWRNIKTIKTNGEHRVKLIVDDNEAINHLNALHDRIMAIDREITRTNNNITGGQGGCKEKIG